jgi:hypothetical protein
MISGACPIAKVDTQHLNELVPFLQRKTVASQWRKCRHLIIDEISMVEGNFFKKLEAVARYELILNYKHFSARID